jgi:small GTP-binding protein
MSEQDNSNKDNKENDDNVLQDVNNRPTIERQTENRYTEVDMGYSIEGYGEAEDPGNKEEEKKEEEEVKDNSNIIKKENKSNINNNNKQTFNFKIIVLGDIAVGKTSVIGRYITNTFSEEYKSSISCEYKEKKIDIDGENIANLQIWDTCGEEKFMAVTKQYYNDAHGAIVIYDLTDKKTFEKLESWIESLKNNAPAKIAIMIAGNKSDLSDKKVNLENELKPYKEKYQCYEISAKSGANISLVFEDLTHKIIEKLNEKDKEEKAPPRESIALKNVKEKKKKNQKPCSC